MTQDHSSFATTTIQHARPWRLRLGGLCFGLLVLGGSHAGEKSTPGALVVAAGDAAKAAIRSKQSRMWMTVGERRFAVTLADTEAARAFAARPPMTLEMTDLNGN